MTSRLPLLLAGAAVCALASQAVAEPRAQIRGEIDGDLKRQLEQAIGDVDGAPSSRFEARRRARAAVTSAQALLRSEGYYQATVEDQVEGDDKPVAIVQIAPGRRFVLGETTINWTAPAPDAETSAAVIEDIRLKPGEPGRAAEILEAEGRVVAGLTRRGYADAAALPRRVVVDHATFLVQPGFNINSGELVRLNGIQLRTRGPTKESWLQSLVPWEEGDRYDPEDVAELERRLLDTGVYDGVGVALSPLDDIRPDGLRPVVVTLADRPVSLLEKAANLSVVRFSGHWSDLGGWDAR